MLRDQHFLPGSGGTSIATATKNKSGNVGGNP
jgi:hypothetical protein